MDQLIHAQFFLRKSIRDSEDQLARLKDKCKFTTPQNTLPYCQGPNLDRSTEEQMQSAFREYKLAITRIDDNLMHILAEKGFDESMVEFENFTEFTSFGPKDQSYPKFHVYKEGPNLLGFVTKSSPYITEYFQNIGSDCKPKKWFVDINGQRETIFSLRDCEKKREQFKSMPVDLVQLIEQRCTTIFGMKPPAKAPLDKSKSMKK